MVYPYSQREHCNGDPSFRRRLCLEAAESMKAEASYGVTRLSRHTRYLRQQHHVDYVSPDTKTNVKRTSDCVFVM